MSLWTDLLHSPVMALPVPCLWLCLSYFKEARCHFPLCVAARGQQLGCAYESSATSQGVQGHACSCFSQILGNRFTACVSCKPGAKDYPQLAGETCLLAASVVASEALLGLLFGPRELSASVAENPLTIKAKETTCKLATGNGPQPMLTPSLSL